MSWLSVRKEMGGMELVILVILFILGMPLWGIFLMVDKSQDGNRLLGIVVFVVGILIWLELGHS